MEERRDVEFRVGELDGCQLIEVFWPRTLDRAHLPATIAHYYGLFDEGRPTVLLSDATLLEALDEDIYQVLRVVLGRVRVQSGFIGGAWFVGGNAAIGEVVRRALAEAGRSPASVLVTRAEAIAYLRDRIRDSRAPSPPEGAE